MSRVIIRQRIPWFAIFLGLVLGVITGLGYAWYVNPVSFVNIAPDRLTLEGQREYILLVGEAYLYDGDIDRARMRLEALAARDMVGLVTGEADRVYLTGEESTRVRALTTLAEALGGSPLGADVFSGTVAPTSVAGVATSTPTFEGIPTLTPSPADLTPTPTPFVPTLTPTRPISAVTTLMLIALNTICDDEYPAGLIEIWVRDEYGEGIPAIEILVEWAGGKETFFTGLKPEIDPGFADFEMASDRYYTVTLVGLSEPVVGLSSDACYTGTGGISIPTYQLVFEPVGGEE